MMMTIVSDLNQGQQLCGRRYSNHIDPTTQVVLILMTSKGQKAKLTQWQQPVWELKSRLLNCEVHHSNY